VADADTRAAVAATFVRLVLDFRLIAVLLTVAWLNVGGERSPLVVAAAVVVGLLSFAALMQWARIGRFVAAHPGVLAIDLVVGFVMLTLVGVDSPFVYVLLGTALLAGVLYGYLGAGVFGALLIACHQVAALSNGTPVRFWTVVTMPVLYPVAAAAAAAIGRLFIERSAAVRRAADAEARSAVARDLHDTLAKTVHGLWFTATALESAAASGDAGAVRRHTSALRTAATRADQEARALMRGWREGAGGRPLPAALDTAVRECVGESELQVDLDVPEDITDLDAATRRELELIVREALRNVVAHAQATRARVRLTANPGGTLRLSVADDGVGWPAQSRLTAAAGTGRYGLVGMTERVRRLGGVIELGTDTLGGAVVQVEVPLGARRSAPPHEEVGA
jgi:signal transduction histidine kinase